MSVFDSIWNASIQVLNAYGTYCRPSRASRLWSFEKHASSGLMVFDLGNRAKASQRTHDFECRFDDGLRNDIRLTSIRCHYAASTSIDVMCLLGMSSGSPLPDKTKMVIKLQEALNLLIIIGRLIA